MRDEDDGLVVGRQDILEELAFRLWIQGTRSLIKEHDATVAEKAASYGDTLGLSLAQSPTLFATDGI